MPVSKVDKFWKLSDLFVKVSQWLLAFQNFLKEFHKMFWIMNRTKV